MAMGQLNQEPSMEDILASIKRIIAEDSEATPRPPRVRKGPVAVPDPAPEPVEAPIAAAEPEPHVEEDARPDWMPPLATPEEEPVVEAPVAEEASDVLELTSPFVEPEPEAMPAPVAASSFSEPEPAAAPATSEGILSGAAAVASRNAFAALSQLQVRTEEAKPNTLEGLVADLLKPMLREWLDKELPAIVERIVTAEVQRVSRG